MRKTWGLQELSVWPAAEELPAGSLLTGLYEIGKNIINKKTVSLTCIKTNHLHVESGSTKPDIESSCSAE